MTVFSLNWPLGQFSLDVRVLYHIKFTFWPFLLRNGLKSPWKRKLIFRSSQTIMPCIVGEWAGGRSVAVAFWEILFFPYTCKIWSLQSLLYEIHMFCYWFHMKVNQEYLFFLKDKFMEIHTFLKVYLLQMYAMVIIYLFENHKPAELTHLTDYTYH